MIAFREFRSKADDVNPTPIEDVKYEKHKAFKKTGDPWLFELLMSDRHVIDGKIQPYLEHPEYLKRTAEENSGNTEAPLTNETLRRTKPVLKRVRP